MAIGARSETFHYELEIKISGQNFRNFQNEQKSTKTYYKLKYTWKKRVWSDKDVLFIEFGIIVRFMYFGEKMLIVVWTIILARKLFRFFNFDF